MRLTRFLFYLAGFLICNEQICLLLVGCMAYLVQELGRQRMLSGLSRSGGKWLVGH